MTPVKLLIPILLLACLFDIKTKIIPVYLTVGGIALGIFFTRNIVFSSLGVAIGFLSVWIINNTRLHILGGGDAKLFSVIGSFLGWQITLLSIFLAWVLYMPFKTGEPKPYAPFILTAVLLLVVYG